MSASWTQPVLGGTRSPLTFGNGGVGSDVTLSSHCFPLKQRYSLAHRLKRKKKLLHPIGAEPHKKNIQKKGVGDVVQNSYYLYPLQFEAHPLQVLRIVFEEEYSFNSSSSTF